jgi:HK97 family phage portal protein
MGVLDNIRERKAALAIRSSTLLGFSDRKTEIAAGAMRIGVQDRPRYPDVSPEALAKAHRRNELVFACVQAKANAMADPRLVVEERQPDGTYAEVPGHPLRRLWMRPNDKMDEAAFLRALVVSRDIFGKFVNENLTSGADMLVGLNPLNPAKISPKAEADAQGRQLLAGYVWRDGGSAVTFRTNELTIYEPPDWVNPPAAEVGLGSVDGDNAQTDYVRAFFNNAGVPSGILKVKGTYSQEKTDNLKGKWRANYGRVTGHQHDIAVLDDNADYQAIGAKLNELSADTIRMTTESRIAMVFGVPPLIVYAYVGLMRATYSNLKEAYKGFWDLTLSPLLKEIAAWVTLVLLPQFEPMERILDEQIRVRFDTSRVAALQDDEDRKQARARDSFRAGGLTLNEFRAAIGQAADSEGDYYLRLLSYAPYAAGTAPQTTADDVLAGKSRPALLPAPGQGQKAGPPRAVEDRLERALRSYLEDEYAAAAEAAREGRA